MDWRAAALPSPDSARADILLSERQQLSTRITQPKSRRQRRKMQTSRMFPAIHPTNSIRKSQYSTSHRRNNLPRRRSHQKWESLGLFHEQPQEPSSFSPYGDHGNSNHPSFGYSS